MQGNRGVARLTRVIQDQVYQHAPAAKPMYPWLEAGTVNADLSISLDNFGPAIPFGNWWWLRHLNQTAVTPWVTADTVTSGAASAGTAHTHPVTSTITNPPPQFTPPSAGDRVLLCWISDFTDPVVLGTLRRP